MERIAIVLEIIAFFMVTTELYGESRLDDLHTRIKEACPKIQMCLERWHGRTIKFLNHTYSLKTFEVITISCIALSCTVFALITGKRFGDLSPILQHSLLIFLLLIFLYEVTQLYASMVRDVLWSIGLVVWLLSCTLRKMKFRGVLLVGGSICFLICKSIQFYIAIPSEANHLRDVASAVQSEEKSTNTK